MPRKKLPSKLAPVEFGLEHDEEEEITSCLSQRTSQPVVPKLWSPRPLPPPSIDPEFRTMGWLERSAEVIRFSLLCLEYWVSGSGILREWLRLNLWVALFLFSAAILIIPAATAVVGGAVEFTGLFERMVENTTGAIMKLPPVVLGIATLLVVGRILYRHWQRKRHSRRDYRESDFEDYQ
jgi:hypothetical protein